MLKTIMKRTVSMLLTFCLALSLSVGSANAAESLIASPSKTSFVMNGTPIFVPQAYNVKDNNYLQLRAIALLLNGTESQFNVSWDGTYAVIETSKQYSGTANPASLETTSNVKLSSNSFKLDDKVVTFEKAYLIDGDTNYLQLREVAQQLSGTKSQFNVYWDDELKQAVIETGTAYTGGDVATGSGSEEIKTAKELESYLQHNFGELKTELKNFDFSNSIKVIENESRFKCYDIAIIIPWSTFEYEYYGIRNSIKYTEEQRNRFEASVENYLKSIADFAIGAMPTKKFRGGFLQTGYRYPNLKLDYYENTIFGWNNYEYSAGKIMPFYEDTRIAKFHWHLFSTAYTPMDEI